jgi:hypothetical protein
MKVRISAVESFSFDICIVAYTFLKDGLSIKCGFRNGISSNGMCDVCDVCVCVVRKMKDEKDTQERVT